MAFLALCMSVFAQLPVNEKTKKVTFIDVQNAEGLSNEKLQAIVKEWATKSKEQPLQLEFVSEVPGENVVYNAKQTFSYKGVKKEETGEVLYSFSVFFKDGKYRIIVTDMVHQGKDNKAASGGKLEAISPECGKDKLTAAAWLTIKKRVHTDTNKQIADLKRVIKEIQNDPANSSDW